MKITSNTPVILVETKEDCPKKVKKLFKTARITLY